MGFAVLGAMPKLVPIEDRTYAFAVSLVTAFRVGSPVDEAERVCWKQLLRCGTSAGANSAESGGAQSRRDWIMKRFIALKEMREAKFWLRLIGDTNVHRRSQLAALVDEADQLIAILTVALRSARANLKKAGE
jgi:four helix bundle protein